MNLANVKEFIKSGINEKLSEDQMWGGAVALAIFSSMFLAVGCFNGGIFLAYSIVGYILVASSLISCFIILKNFNLKKRIQYNAFISLHYTLIFSLASYIIMKIYQIELLLLAILLPLVFALISILYAIVNLKLEVFLNQNKRKNTSWVLIGVSIGILFSRTVFDFDNMDENTSFMIGVLSMTGMASICALGAWNFIKLYYIKVLESQGIDIEK